MRKVLPEIMLSSALLCTFDRFVEPAILRACRAPGAQGATHALRNSGEEGRSLTTWMTDRSGRSRSSSSGDALSSTSWATWHANLNRARGELVRARRREPRTARLETVAATGHRRCAKASMFARQCSSTFYAHTASKQPRVIGQRVSVVGVLPRGSERRAPCRRRHRRVCSAGASNNRLPDDDAARTDGTPTGIWTWGAARAKGLRGSPGRGACSSHRRRGRAANAGAARRLWRLELGY